MNEVRAVLLTISFLLPFFFLRVKLQRRRSVREATRTGGKKTRNRTSAASDTRILVRKRSNSCATARIDPSFSFSFPLTLTVPLPTFERKQKRDIRNETLNWKINDPSLRTESWSALDTPQTYNSFPSSSQAYSVLCEPRGVCCFTQQFSRGFLLI